MKDYKRIAKKIRKMGKFSDVHNCGYPTENYPVNLCCELSEPYIIGYIFYIAYDFGEWSIDYTFDPSIKLRSNMQHINGIKTDKEMYMNVEKIISEIRNNIIRNGEKSNVT